MVPARGVPCGAHQGVITIADLKGKQDAAAAAELVAAAERPSLVGDTQRLDATLVVGVHPCPECRLCYGGFGSG